MANYELVSKVAHLRSISRNYVDFRGQHSEVPIENLSEIVRAMGYSVDDDAKLQQEAIELDTHQWQVLLEPVTVLSPLRGCWGVCIYLPDSESGQEGQWQIDLENGQSVSDSFRVSEQRETGEYWLDGTRYVRRLLSLPEGLPLGYHSICVTVADRTENASLVVTPKSCFHSEPMDRGDKIWGTAIQLYTLRSENNWGMGDFGDLDTLIHEMAAQGADVIGLNPIHALYPISPDHCSPYSPSDRSFLNVLYVSVPDVDEFEHSPALKRKLGTKKFNGRVEKLRETENVDYAGVSELKYEFFEVLYKVFKKRHLGKKTDRGLAYARFLEEQGSPLQQHAIFSALLAHFNKADSECWGWPTWPEEYQDHQSEAVKQFALEHADEVSYWCYLQFIADEQLSRLDELAKTLGMKIGLYRDLAVGADRGGAEVWCNREDFCLDASIGAPPDALGPNGQNWGLPPLDPIQLKDEKYQAFITLLRNNMRACGALRIDHALALLRLWWCPPGADASHGAYVYYDLFDMLGLLNLESQRNRCMVIAEDLGTVPYEVMHYFPQAELYSNKVFYFEMNDGGCTEPEHYAEKALAIVCNHDMPTVNAFWDKSDLDLRKDLGMFASEEDFQNESNRREHAKYLILDLLNRYGRLPEEMTVHPADAPEMTVALNQAIHFQLASTASQIIAVQLEDMMNIKTPVNVPGTSDEYLNWRRKLTMSSSELFSKDEIKQFCQQLGKLRQK